MKFLNGNGSGGSKLHFGGDAGGGNDPETNSSENNPQNI